MLASRGFPAMPVRSKRLVVPVVLAVTLLGPACTGGEETKKDAGNSSSSSGGLADAGTPDAGCAPFEVYDTITGMCVPLA